MAIRKRLITTQFDNTQAQSGTDLVMFAVRMPATGKIKSVSVTAGVMTGTATVNLTKSGVVGSTAAASTTAANSAGLVIAATDTPYQMVLKTDGTQNFIEGEYLYFKCTTASTSTLGNVSIGIEVDY